MPASIPSADQHPPDSLAKGASAQFLDSVAARGDAAAINTWSGIPYHFCEAGNQMGWALEPWRLRMESFAVPRIAWNATQLILGRGARGFQYSREFLDAAEATIPDALFRGRALTFHQHFPRSASLNARGGSLIHYIDAPVAAFLEGKGLELRLPERARRQMLAQERENFELATMVFCMTEWVAEAVSSIHGIATNKLRVVLPGANLSLPDDFTFRDRPGRPGVDRPAVFGFVGRDWQRKGLEFLLQVRFELERLGLKACVRAVGVEPKSGPADPGLEALGLINKQSHPERFLAFLTGCDLGCLFSRRECTGFSTLEFLRAGVPVTGFLVDGIPDTLFPEASMRFEPTASAQEVAEALNAIFRDESAWAAKVAGARARSPQMTWKRCLLEMAGHLAH